MWLWLLSYLAPPPQHHHLLKHCTMSSLVTHVNTVTSVSGDHPVKMISDQRITRHSDSSQRRRSVRLLVLWCWIGGSQFNIQDSYLVNELEIYYIFGHDCLQKPLIQYWFFIQEQICVQSWDKSLSFTHSSQGYNCWSVDSNFIQSLTDL